MEARLFKKVPPTPALILKKGLVRYSATEKEYLNKLIDDLDLAYDPELSSWLSDFATLGYSKQYNDFTIWITIHIFLPARKCETTMVVANENNDYLWEPSTKGAYLPSRIYKEFNEWLERN